MHQVICVGGRVSNISRPPPRARSMESHPMATETSCVNTGLYIPAAGMLALLQATDID